MLIYTVRNVLTVDVLLNLSTGTNTIKPVLYSLMSTRFRAYSSGNAVFTFHGQNDVTGFTTYTRQGHSNAIHTPVTGY